MGMVPVYKYIIPYESLRECCLTDPQDWSADELAKGKGGGGHRNEKILVSWSVPTVPDHVANVLIRVILIVTFSTYQFYSATTGNV